MRRIQLYNDLAEEAEAALKPSSSGQGLDYDSDDAAITHTPAAVGHAILDPVAYSQGRVVVKRGGDVIVDQPLTHDFHRLLHNRYSHARPYSEKAKRLYRHVAPLIGVIPPRSSPKWQIVFGPREHEPMLTTPVHTAMVDPNSWITRLSLIMGEVKAGNTSRLLRAEAVDIVDLLEKYGYMTSDTARELMEQLVSF